jgi:hypothetical protein
MIVRTAGTDDQFFGKHRSGWVMMLKSSLCQAMISGTSEQKSGIPNMEPHGWA